MRTTGLVGTWSSCMRVFITGANGYLGKHIAAVIKQTTHEIVEVVHRYDGEKIVCDLNNQAAVKKLFDSNAMDLVIHCAAFVPKSREEYNDVIFSENNAAMLKNIILSTTCPIIYISSMTVYGDVPFILRREKDAGNPESAYGQSKYDGETLLKESGRDALAVRIPGLFGGGRQTGLVANTIRALVKGQAPVLPITALMWAGMDIQDAAEIISKLALTSFTGFNPINVGYDNIYSINKLVGICEGIFNIDVGYAFQHPEFAFDLFSLRSFGIDPAGNLQSAIAKQVQSLT